MSHKEDYINIFLMLLSCGLAFVLPFELFLFSYAILGPLHYLTEISWLHQRNYFSTGKKDYIALIILCFLISLGVIFNDIFISRHYFEGVFSPEMLQKIIKTYGAYFPTFITMAFVGALGLLIFNKPIYKISLFLVGFLIGYLLKDNALGTVILGVFIPTLMHVYLFTALFMLYGALKSKSVPGYVSVFLLVACALSFYFIQYVPDNFSASAYVKHSLVDSGFASVNIAALGFFKSGGITMFDIFESRKGLMVQRFIAFAYTYHYLNWFSKTEIIKWHLVPKKWLISSIVIWIASIALYYFDYKTGLVALFFLSLLHVFLEFPLNFKSILGIGEELKNKLSFSKSTK
jgi:hypothetical protein